LMMSTFRSGDAQTEYCAGTIKGLEKELYALRPSSRIPFQRLEVPNTTQ
jgi:hypothetical protein